MGQVLHDSATMAEVIRRAPATANVKKPAKGEPFIRGLLPVSL